MSKEYRQQTEQFYEDKIKGILKEAPSYLSEFYSFMSHGSREITTQFAYLSDILAFLKFEKENISELKEKNIKDFPVEILSSLNLQDINEYKNYLFDKRKLTNSSAKKKLAALSAFFKFLNTEQYITNNPMLNFDFPVINKKRIVKLDAELSDRLLNGILENDKYLATSEYGEFIVDIPPAVKIKRERLVLRNYAICYLLLGTGLRVSELVGLDLDDINFRQNSLNVILKGGDETQVYFGDEVANALKLYLDGPTASPTLFEKFSPISAEAEWAKKHICDENFEINLKKDFPYFNLEAQNEIRKISSFYRRHGRSGFKPSRSCNAVFLSTRGTRITVRMVEIMIKEMAKTYLPEYEDRDIFSPHKLRATCATRILSQTGNLELASTQLNHKGVAVTASFYAELQREKRKDQIKNLDVTKW